MSKLPLSRLYTYAREYQSRFYIASLYSILNKVFDLAPPLLIGMAVEVVVSQGKIQFLVSHNIEGILPQLTVVSILTVIVWGLESLFEYFYAIEWRGLAQQIQHLLRLDSYRHIQKQELQLIEQEGSGSLMTVVNDDVNQLERFLDSGANDMLQLLTTILIIGGIFFYIQWQVALIAVFPIPLIAFASLKFQKGLEPLYKEVRDRAGILNHELSNHLQGMPTILAFHRLEEEANKMNSFSLDYLMSNEKVIARSSLFIPLIRMLIMISFIGTLLLGGTFVQAGILGVGNYSVLVFLTQRLLWPLTRFGQTLDLYQRANGSLQRIFKLLDRQTSLLEGELILPKEKVQGSLNLNHVKFSYPGAKTVFQDLNLSIQPGQTIGFVGETGAGKSTLIKLLLRFYDVDSGIISLDGMNLRELRFESLRKAIGFVSQDVFLFHGTLRDNLLFGLENCEEGRLKEVLEIAEAWEFVQSLPRGLDTIVGERGQKLSGGQRQRVSIARALLPDPPILIFDEATSSVDNQTEAAIQRSLIKITKDRTTIIIAHRLSTIVHADQIYVMGDGKILEHGSHEALIQKKGPYLDLWNVQTGSQNS